MCLNLCTIQKEHQIASEDVWAVTCVFPGYFKSPLLSQLPVWIAAESSSFVLLRFAEHHNEIESGDFFSAFFVSSIKKKKTKKLVVPNLE